MNSAIVTLQNFARVASPYAMQAAQFVKSQHARVLLAIAVYRVADQALANLAGLETMTHGTAPQNWLGIQLLGGRVSRGGKGSGATASVGYPDQTQGRFYMMCSGKNAAVDACLKGFWSVESRIVPRFYRFLSSMSLLGLTSSSEKRPKWFEVTKKVVGLPFGIVGSLMSPVIKFRYTDKQIDTAYWYDLTLEKDLMNPGAIYSTQNVGASRIGLRGTLRCVFADNPFTRIKRHPARFLTGVVQSTAAVGMGVLLLNPGYMATSRLVSGVAYAAIAGGFLV